MLIGLDPGRNLGIAYVHEDGRLERAEIILIEELGYLTLPANSKIIVGDGTGSKRVQKLLHERNLDFQLVSEAGTTLEARELYFQAHPPPFWMRLLPEGLRFPPRPIDDYAAYVIVLRYLNKTSRV